MQPQVICWGKVKTHTNKRHDWKCGKRRQTRKESASYVSRLFLIPKVFSGESHHHWKSLSVMQLGQLANDTVWWFLFTWSILSCRIKSVKPSLLFISSSSWKNIYIILIIFVQCFGAGSVMLWDKESIKLKFVSAAGRGTQSSSASTRTVALAQNFTPSTWIKIQRCICICICICKWIQYISRSRKYLEDWRSFYSGGVSWKSSSLMKPSPPAS